MALSREAQVLCFFAGANSIFYGEKLLTTGNPDVSADQSLLRDAGLRPAEAAEGARARPNASRSLDAADMAKHAPWKQPWWRAAQGDGPLFWMIVLHVGAIAGLLLFPLPAGACCWGRPDCTSWADSARRSLPPGLAHKSVRLHPVARNVLTFFAMLNGSGSPLSWVANHRLHHAKSDTLEDISSPMVGGFWWSHLRWLWQAGAPPVTKYCRDLDTPAYPNLDAVQIPLILVVLHRLAVRAGGVLLVGPIRMAFALHAQCFVNSICHLRRAPFPAKRPRGTSLGCR